MPRRWSAPPHRAPVNTVPPGDLRTQDRPIAGFTRILSPPNRPGDQPGRPRSPNAYSNSTSGNNSPSWSWIRTASGPRHRAYFASTAETISLAGSGHGRGCTDITHPSPRPDDGEHDRTPYDLTRKAPGHRPTRRVANLTTRVHPGTKQPDNSTVSVFGIQGSRGSRAGLVAPVDRRAWWRGVGQVWSRRGKSTSWARRSRAAAAGMATRAPTIPSRAPPTRTATTVTRAGILTARPMILGTSR